jgi:hypothetical protein
MDQSHLYFSLNGSQCKRAGKRNPEGFIYFPDLFFAIHYTSYLFIGYTYKP